MTNAAQELRDLVDERVRAVHSKDLAPLAAQLADDVVAFNVLPPLQLHGAAEVIEQTKAWFAAYPGPIGYEVEQFAAHASGDVGFCSFVYHVTGELADGNQVDMWVRASLGWRRVDGAWRIVHDHESVPFDPATGAALLSLKP
ncbi:YybH family protein [Lentzea sp. NPDC004789]